MSRRDPNRGLCTILAAALLLGVVPACNGSGFSFRRTRVATPDGSGNIVYRPVYPLLPTPKPIYPGGYAGTVYPPLGFGRPVNPTQYTAPVDPNCPPQRRWGWWRR